MRIWNWQIAENFILRSIFVLLTYSLANFLHYYDKIVISRGMSDDCEIAITETGKSEKFDQICILLG